MHIVVSYVHSTLILNPPTSKIMKSPKISWPSSSSGSGSVFREC